MKRMSRCKIIVVLLVMVIAFVSLQYVAFAGAYGDFNYSSGPNGDITITGYHGSATYVKIPSSINGKAVRAIGDYAFSGCTKMTGVQIPSSITSLGYEAFSGCTSLTSVVLPSSINSYSEYIFRNCTKLTNITFPSTLRYVPAGILSGCSALKSVSLPPSITDICSDAFSGCTNLSTINLPGSLSTIQSGAFYACSSLKSITIPASVDFIGEDAFSNCTKLEKAVFCGNQPDFFFYPSFNWCHSLFKVYYPTSHRSSWADFAYYPSQAYSLITVYPQNGNASFKVIANVNNGRIGAPAAPAWVGHTFVGWYKQAACTSAWNFNTAVISGDISVYAKWTTIKYAITATTTNSSYGTVTGGGSCAYGSTATVKATPKPGCRFVRWLEGSTPVSTSSSYSFNVTKARTLKAEFARIGTPVVKAASVGYSSIKLTWPAIAGANGYVVYRATSANGAYTYIATTADAGYTSKGLTTGTTYYYKVRTMCVAGNTTTYGSYSAVAYARPVPATPTDIKATRVSSTSVKVTWKAVWGVTGYEVYRATSKTGIYTKVLETTSTSYTNTKLTTGKTYYYKVRAYRLVGSTRVYGNFSVIVYARP